MTLYIHTTLSHYENGCHTSCNVSAVVLLAGAGAGDGAAGGGAAVAVPVEPAIFHRCL